MRQLGRCRRTVVLVVAALLYLGPLRVASAQAQDAAAAAELFDQGLQLLEEERYAEACTKLDASQGLDPQVGTLLYLGYCLEKQGLAASAFARYREAQDLARAQNDDRESLASERAEALRSKLSRLTVSVASAEPGLEVWRDGVRIDPNLWGTGVPIDPGSYTIEARAPGKHTWRQTVRVEPGGVSAAVQVPELEPVASKPAESTPAPPASTPPRDEGPAPGEGLGAQRTWSLVIAGVGLAGVGVGAWFGQKTSSTWSEAERRCPDNICENRADVTLEDDARGEATVSTIAFAAGGALLAGAAVLWWTAPSGRENATTARRTHVTLSARPGGAELSAGGTF